MAHDKRKGSLPEPKHSIELTPNSNHPAHLYSPQIKVIANSEYSILAYVNATDNDNKTGLYIDEYDADGDWINGQYFVGTLFSDDKSIGVAYKHSVGASYARLQFIVEGSNAHVFIDEVLWRASHQN